MRRAGQAVSKAEILHHVWDAHYDGDANVVEVYVGYLRRKIDTPVRAPERADGARRRVPARGRRRLTPGRRGTTVARGVPSSWRQLSLRGRLTLVATALLTGAVITGALLTIFVVRRSLTSALDSSAVKTARDIAALPSPPRLIAANNSGVVAIQIVDADNGVVSNSPGADAAVSMVSKEQLAAIRSGHAVSVRQSGTSDSIRVLGVITTNGRTVLVASDAERIDQSTRIVENAALVGAPLAIIAMALLTYFIVGRHPAPGRRPAPRRRGHHGGRPVRSAPSGRRRRGRDPPPRRDAERHARSHRRRHHPATDVRRRRRARTEVAARIVARAARGVAAAGRGHRLAEVVSDVLVDVDRLDNLVADLLLLARIDESGGVLHHRDAVELATLVEDVDGQLRLGPRPRDLRAGVHRHRRGRRRRTTTGRGQPRRQRPALRPRLDRGHRARRRAARRTHRRPTTAPASPRPSANGSSTASTAPRARAHESRAAPASGCRSSATLSARTAARSGWWTTSRACAPSSTCRSAASPTDARSARRQGAPACCSRQPEPMTTLLAPASSVRPSCRSASARRTGRRSA